jgi:hypothetical protein
MHVRIHLRDCATDHLDGPEMSRKDCQAQVDYIAEHICSHVVRHEHEETGSVIRETHKEDAPGTPGVLLELGWATVVNGIVDDVEIVA